MMRGRMAAAALLAATLCVPAMAMAQATPATGKPAAVAANDLTVAVTYKGKGTVDATKDILVFVFDHPNPTGESEPLGMKAVAKNGGTATFANLPPNTPLYVFAVYDQEGTYTGTEGEPPAGTPVAPYTTTPKGEPAAVKAGAKIKMTFDDSRLWKK